MWGFFLFLVSSAAFGLLFGICGSRDSVKETLAIGTYQHAPPLCCPPLKAMVPEFIHWKSSRMFFHLPDAAQGVRSTAFAGLEVPRTQQSALFGAGKTSDDRFSKEQLWEWETGPSPPCQGSSSTQR